MAALGDRGTKQEQPECAAQQCWLSSPPLLPPPPPLPTGSGGPFNQPDLLHSTPNYAGLGNLEPGFLWFDVPPLPIGSPGAAFALPPALHAAPPLPVPVPPMAPGMQQPQPPQQLIPVGGLQSAGQQKQQQQQQQEEQQQQPAHYAGAGSCSNTGRQGQQQASSSRSQRSGVTSKADRQAEQQRRTEEKRARNRATQARFRERQKAKADAFLQQHAAAEAELEQTRAEQQQLSTQSAVMGKMLGVKEEVLASLSAAMPAAAGHHAQAQQEQAPQRQPMLQPPKPEQQQQQHHHHHPGFQHSQQAQLQEAAQGGPPQTVGPPTAAEAAAAVAVAAAARPQRQRQLSGEIAAFPLSSAEAEHFGATFKAHLAQLELPVGTHPDEAMAVAHAHLPPPPELVSAPRKPRLPPLQHGSAGPSAVADTASGGSSSSSGTGADVGAARTAAAETAAGGGAGAGLAVIQERGSGHEREEQMGSQGQPLAALMKDNPELVEEVLSGSPEDFVQEWKAHAKSLKDILHCHDETRSEAELARILGIQRDFSNKMTIVLLVKPEHAHSLFASSANAPPGLWEAVAECLAPTHAQRTMLRQMWHTFVGRLLSIRAERAAAAQAVVHAAEHAANHGAHPVSLPAASLSALMSRYLALFDAAGKLSTLKDAEFVALLQFLGRIGAILSPVQKARVAAASWPFFPDIVQVTRLMVEDAGEPGQGVGADQMEVAQQIWPPPQGLSQPPQPQPQ